MHKAPITTETESFGLDAYFEVVAGVNMAEVVDAATLPEVLPAQVCTVWKSSDEYQVDRVDTVVNDVLGNL